LLLQRAPAATDESLALAESVVAAHPGAADGWAAVASALYGHLSFGTVDAAAWTRAAARGGAARARARPVATGGAAHARNRRRQGRPRLRRGRDAVHARARRGAALHVGASQLRRAARARGPARDAEVELNVARLHDPLSASVHLACAVLCGYARRSGDARAAWSLCRAAGEASAWVRLGEASNELADGQAGLAASMIDEARAGLPDLPAVLVGRAVARAAQGDPAGALALERECAERFPHYSPAQRAVPAARRGDRAQALA
jgi:hypothetical protein